MCKFVYEYDIEKIRKFNKNLKPIDSVSEEGYNLYGTNEISATIAKSGYISLMCPNCHSLYNLELSSVQSAVAISENSDLDINIFIDTTINVYQCPHCGNEENNFIELDPNIAQAISILNKKGYRTKFCCEGHKAQGTSEAYIYFNYKNILDYIHLLPDTWYLDLECIKGQIGYKRVIIIRSEYYNHDEAMHDILEFANNLPQLDNETILKEIADSIRVFASSRKYKFGSEE